MMDLPDAPWIRDAEINGMPDAPDIYCPVCGAKDPDYIFTDGDGTNAVGCDCCLKRHDAQDWWYEVQR